MALKVVSMAEMRLEVLLEAERSGEPIAELCRRRGIARSSFYVWRARCRPHPNIDATSVAGGRARREPR